MADPFESPLFLVAQTKENLAEFDRACDAFFNANSSTNVVDVDPRTGNKTFKVKFGGKVPGKIRHLATSAITDMRNALDQASCAAVKTITGNDPGLLYFPFATNPNDLSGRLRKSFPDEIHPTFQWCQPYPTGTGYVGGDDLLCRFSRASGPNKHQVSCEVGGQITEFRANSIRGHGLIIEMGLPPQWDIDNNELIIGIASPTGHIDYDFGMSFYIALAEASELSGAPASPILRTLLNTVERIVLAIRSDTQVVAGRKF